MALSLHLPARFGAMDVVSSTPWQIVVRAWDKVLDREVLLQLPGEAYRRLLDKPKDRERLLREARHLARLHHPSITQIFEILDVPNGPLLVIESKPGEALRSRLERDGGRIEESEILKIAASVAEALEAVHSARLVHRNVAAENIILRANGTIALIGFVFSKVADPRASVSLDFNSEVENWKDSALPAHPAPEVLQGIAADARSDIFSLGCVLYACLTGKDITIVDLKNPDFDARNLVKAESVSASPKARAVADILSRCLAPSPGERFQSASELVAMAAAGLAEAGKAGGTTGEGPVYREPAGEPSSHTFGPVHSRVWIALGVGLISLLAVLVGPRLGGNRRAHDAAGEQRGEPLATNTKSSPVGSSGSAADQPGEFLPEYRNSYALLVGIGRAYAPTAFRILPNCERDVADLASQLESMTWEKWQVRTLIGAQATEAAIRDELQRLSEEAGVDDRVLVYYAGHGAKHPTGIHSGWIIPVNALPVRQDRGRSTWLSYDDLTQFYDQCRAKHILIALDCCYGGTGAQTPRSGAEQYRRAFLTRKAHVILASSRDDQVAMDGPDGGHSLFAEVFLKSLKTPGEPLVTSALAVDVQNEFFRKNLNQLPVCRQFDFQQSDFVFFRQAEAMDSLKVPDAPR